MRVEASTSFWGGVPKNTRSGPILINIPDCSKRSGKRSDFLGGERARRLAIYIAETVFPREREGGLSGHLPREVLIFAQDADDAALDFHVVRGHDDRRHFGIRGLQPDF